MKHLLKIKGETIELSTVEAKRLLEELKEVFGEPSFPPVVLPYPVYPPPHEQFPPQPWVVTCEVPVVTRTINPMVPTMCSN